MGIVHFSRGLRPCNYSDAKPVRHHYQASDTQNKRFMQKQDWAEQFPSAYPASSLAHL